MCRLVSRLLGGWHDDASCWLVLPRMQRTLRHVRPSRLQQQSGGLQGGPLRIARCVASAMSYLHKHGVVHRDLQVGVRPMGRASVQLLSERGEEFASTHAAVSRSQPLDACRRVTITATLHGGLQDRA